MVEKCIHAPKALPNDPNSRQSPRTTGRQQNSQQPCSRDMRQRNNEIRARGAGDGGDAWERSH